MISHGCWSTYMNLRCLVLIPANLKHFIRKNKYLWKRMWKEKLVIEAKKMFSMIKSEYRKQQQCSVSQQYDDKLQ